MASTDTTYLDIDANGDVAQQTAIAASVGAADANKIIRADANGDLDPSFFPPEALLEAELINATLGAADANKAVKTDAAGLIDASFLVNAPSSDHSLIDLLPVSASILVGQIANLYDNGGTLYVRTSVDSGIDRRIHGVVTIGGGGNIEIKTSGEVTVTDTLVVGLEYFVSNVAGSVTATPPTAAGTIVQKVGIARTTTTLLLDIREPRINA